MTDKPKRTDAQKRAERNREARGRPGWKGSVTLSQKRHNRLKALMLPGESEQQAIIRLLKLDDGE